MIPKLQKLLLICVTLFFAQSATALQENDIFCFDLATCCQSVPDTTSLADWNNCEIFYLCFGGVATSFNCSSDKPNYNPETRQCVEQVSGCEGGTRAPIESTTEAVTFTTTSITTTPQPGNGNCTESGAYFIPYPGDCKKYMICANFVLLPDPQECPQGTLFDPELRECNLEFLVECPPICPDGETIYLPHDKNCSLYWLCASSSNATLRQCPQGLIFDPKLKTCNIEELVFCPNLCPIELVINLPHATNCSLYWLCTLGEATLRQCAPNLLFDPILGQCNIANSVDCFGNSNFKVMDNAFDEYDEDNSDYMSDEWDDVDLEEEDELFKLPIYGSKIKN